MQKIHLLDSLEVQKIAAGEVIERPVGVLKECIENSLDADATMIKIQIEKAGKQKIRILDNGSGMNPDDLPRAIQPFATSKIKKVDDLQQVETFGFRGEALASIASISKLTIQSSEKNVGIGHQLIVHAGMIQKEQPVAMQHGTDIIIEDLFYNTPVRKKFLRADETEWHAMQQVVYAFCLSNLHVHFTLFRDNKPMLQAPAVTSLQDRICQIWGLPLAQKMIEVTHTNEREKISITGVISEQTVHRYNRQNILYFINGRLVKNNSMAKAIIKGYGLSLPPGRFPIAVILLTMSGIGVDVNIHPRKEEVRFIRPGIVDTTLTEAVRQSLEKNNSDHLQKTIKNNNANSSVNSFFRDFKATKNPFEQSSFEQRESDPFKKMLLTEEKKPLTELFKNDNVVTFKNMQSNIPERTIKEENIKTANNYIDSNSTVEKQSKQLFRPSPPIKNQEQIDHTIPEIPKLIGQCDRTYILLESDDELIMIDQHAAHERILYERWTSKFEQKEGSQLLFPQTVELCKIEKIFVLQMKDFFATQGFEIESMGASNIVVYSAPPHIQGVDIIECIKEVAALHDGNRQISKEDLRKKLNEHMHSHLACKSAIKAGDQLSEKEQLQLIKDLFNTPNRHMCIHGRPTMSKIPKTEIAKRFKRPIQ
ncbi:DNA mismatch repair endonuclease MutL [Candidatus Babeliales bacterium]|nr:DNA mismatch repair endonuclease MutL [Candidatus Babeliales bacterium]